MALRVKGRGRILVGENVGPERKNVIRTYLEPLECEVLEVKFDDESGRLDLEDLKDKAQNARALYVENPNFFGVIEKDVESMSEIIHDSGGLFVVGVDPISLGIIRPPGDYGADIVVGEGQSLAKFWRTIFRNICLQG
jgi:glycine dehydrogenase subunit 1